jgi:hypothetical protein
MFDMPMDPRRKIVTERLSQFVAELAKQFTSRVEEIWLRVENKLSRSEQPRPPHDK